MCRSSIRQILLLVSLLLASCAPTGTPDIAEPAPAATAPTSYTEERGVCAHRNPLRQPLFGELHVHSTLSMDANIWGVRGTPDDVYRFARGETIELSPHATVGRAPRRQRLARPLDFAALTDHAFLIGPVSLCTREDSSSYDTTSCRVFRGEIDAGDLGGRIGALTAGTSAIPSHRVEICGEDGGRCQEELGSVWRRLQDTTERWYDKSSDCSFTTFHAYEYTATPDIAKVHRNVIFRNASVPDLPISFMDEPTAPGLWRQLERQCLEAGTGCEVLTIPHNSNLSNGRMFTLPYLDLPEEEQKLRATLRAELEPVAEIMQIKGDSECRNGLYDILGGADEFCDFEKWRPADTEDCQEGTSAGALLDQGCQSRLDFVRYALIEGLREQERIGINPLKLGILAATDAHNANPGDAEEYSYPGWGGESDDTAIERLTTTSPVGLPPLRNNPGGLAGVWAEENSRDAIFDAMQRRETFGTSGPRMTARFFGSFEFEGDLCETEALALRGYRDGVPMGSDLPARPETSDAPRFVVSALRDPGTQTHPGGLLQRIQIIKGWYDAEGHFHQAVYDVAGGPNDADVDPDTCTPRGDGAEHLCGVFQDPDFDPSRGAVYYARVLENPSCRWSQRQCLALPESERPATCSDPNTPRFIQERLWTSPIWYDPTPSS